MNEISLIQIQQRLQRVERQNRVLIALVCAVLGVASLAATKHGSNVLSLDELRAHRITLTDGSGAVVHSWWATPGAMNE
jgi:hypothetical protein